MNRIPQLLGFTAAAVGLAALGSSRLVAFGSRPGEAATLGWLAAAILGVAFLMRRRRRMGLAAAA
ncbi:MAG: hypothetical protein ACREFX_13265, partial [Opitutaceae bacterium]